MTFYVDVKPGTSPVILTIPHSGTWVPPSIDMHFNTTGRRLADTDWHVDLLYKDLLPDASVVKAKFHRYVIDANRDPLDQSLYPGQNTTSLCPTTDFEGHDIWQPNKAPDRNEIESRKNQFHTPYHDAISQQIMRVKAEHGVAIIFDCHSIRSFLPYLFPGELPMLNVGTYNGVSCASELEKAVFELAEQSEYSSVLNGRFKGGWTTRHYGQPDKGLHAIQLEISQRAYLKAEHVPWLYDAEKADKLRSVLRPMLERVESLAEGLK